MWKPPEKIRHETRPGAWPTAEEARASLLFSPLSHLALALASRTWVPAMVPWRATEEGFVTSDNIGWYARFAQGRPGAIVLEATGIRDVPSGPLLRIGHAQGLLDVIETFGRNEPSHGELVAGLRAMVLRFDFEGLISLTREKIDD